MLGRGPRPSPSSFSSVLTGRQRNLGGADGGTGRDRPLRAWPGESAGPSAAFAKTNLSPEGAGSAAFSRGARGPSAPLEDSSASVNRPPSKPPGLTPAPPPPTEGGARHPAQAPAGDPHTSQRRMGVAVACADPRMGVTARVVSPPRASAFFRVQVCPRPDQTASTRCHAAASLSLPTRRSDTWRDRCGDLGAAVC